MANRIRTVTSRNDFERLVEEFVISGYKLENRGDNSALLRKYKKKDHALVALLTVWWSLGIGNLIYACIPASVEDEVLEKLENE